MASEVGQNEAQIELEISARCGEHEKQGSNFAECQCGNTVTYDDAWDDNSKVVCSKCGADHGTFGDFKRQARDAVNDFIKGNVWKYQIKAPE
jgi:hypothetical protein